VADDNKNIYPWFPVKQWWALRDRFVRNLPGVVDARYVISSLGVGEGTVYDILAGLKAFGIIDGEGKTGDLAEKWRHDDTLYGACREILNRLYPKELQDAAPDPVENRGAAERWLPERSRSENNTRKSLRLYMQSSSRRMLRKSPRLPGSRPNKPSVSARQTASKAAGSQKRQQRPRPLILAPSFRRHTSATIPSRCHECSGALAHHSFRYSDTYRSGRSSGPDRSYLRQYG